MDAFSSYIDRYLAYAAVSERLPTQFWLDAFYFLFICFLIIWPSDLLVRLGLTLESLHPSSLWDDHLLMRLEIKASLNRLFLAILLNSFIFYSFIAYGPLHQLQISLAATTILSYYFFMRLLLRLYYNSRDDASFLAGFTKEEHKSIDCLPYSNSPFFVARSYSNLFLVNDQFFINERRFGYTIERMSDLNFCIYGRSTDTFDEWLTIVAERNDGSKKYSFSIPSGALHSLEDFVVVDIMRSVFKEQFMSRVIKNPRHKMNDISTLDPCFACNVCKPNVIIRKNCCDCCSSCTPCLCRPSWCVGCLIRIFMAPHLKNTRASHWIHGEASCPFCRASFCVEDVHLIEHGTDLDGDTE